MNLTVKDLFGNGIGWPWVEWVGKIRLVPVDGFVTDHLSRDDYPGTTDGWERLVDSDGLLKRLAAGQSATEPATGVPVTPQRIPEGYWRPLKELDGDAADTAFEWVAQFHTDNAPWQGLVLMGAVGAGKTAVAASLAHDSGDPGAYWHVTELIAHIKADRTDFTARAMRTRRLLVVDDLGAEDPGPHDWNVRLLRDLIEGRHRGRAVTIITTNLSWSDIKVRYGARVESRLAEMCRQVVVTGSDRRGSA